MLVLGLDGCGAGWFAVALRGGRFDSARLLPSVEKALEVYPSAEVFAIDIPIGLESGRFRTVDAAAKKLLGSSGSTLFEMPPSEVLRQPDYGAALALCRSLTGKGLSKQAYALRNKVLEVEAVASRDARFMEVHPEICFRALASGTAIGRKKTWNGLIKRRQLLESVGIFVPDYIEEGGHRASPDDVVDAAVAGWSAERRRLGIVERIGSASSEPSLYTPAIYY